MKIFSKDDYIENNLITSSKKSVSGDFSAHGHNFFEIEFIIDGKGIYEIDGIQYEIKKNTLFFMTPANIHSIQNADATLINVMFQYEFAKENIDLSILLSDTSCFTFNEKDGIFLKSILSELAEVNKKEPEYSMLLVNCVLNKLSLNLKSSKDTKDSYIKRAVIYMLENFQNGVTLNTTAKHLGLSSAYFSDIFFRQTGINFKEYLDDLRFSYAVKLLSFTSLSIKEILYASGFYDYANFTRRFKERYKMTPSEYRKYTKK